jgi:hypothetical protein
MKRIVLTLVAAAALTFGFGGFFASTAEAYGPHHGHRHHHHHHGHHHHYGHYHGVYRVYPSRTIVYPSYVPYGVGYPGYYPSSGITIQQPGFGLRIGF